MSPPALVALGLGLMVMVAAVWKGFASLSDDGRRSSPNNNWQNEAYMAAQDGPTSERRSSGSTAPAGYPGESA